MAAAGDSKITIAASANDAFITNANPIVPGQLWLGSEDAAHAPIELLKHYGITHILVCGFGLSMKYSAPEFGIAYHQIKAVDLPVFNILQFVPRANDFITQALKPAPSSAAVATGTDTATTAATASTAEKKSCVLVHCARGKSRSAAFVVAYLMASQSLSFAEAHARVRKARPEISINSSFQQQLTAYQNLRYSIAGTDWEKSNADLNVLLKPAAGSGGGGGKSKAPASASATTKK